MYIMDVPSIKPKRRVCWVWFADTPYIIKNYDEVHFIETSQFHKIANFTYSIFQTLESDLRQPENKLLEKMKKSKRRDLKIAANRGWKLVQGANEELFSTFINYHRDFANRKSLSLPAPLNFFMQNKENLRTAFILKENLPVCWFLYFTDQPITRLWYAGSNLQEKSSERGYAATFLHWEMMKLFKAENYTTYDWGGACQDINDPTYGITQFKASFGGIPVNKYNYTYLRSPVRRFYQKCKRLLGKSVH